MSFLCQFYQIIKIYSDKIGTDVDTWNKLTAVRGEGGLDERR